MAARNLAVVTDGQIVIYDDPMKIDNAGIVARVPLGSRRTTSDYTAALNLAGWVTTRPWGWQETANGALPAAPVERM